MANALSVIDADRYSAAEFRVLDVRRQMDILGELYAELKRLGDLKVMALDVLGDKRMAEKRMPCREAQALVIDAKRHVDMFATAISTRREQVKILQTLVRAVPV